MSGNLFLHGAIEWSKPFREGEPSMQIVVVKSPRALNGLLRLLFGIRKNA